MYVMNLPKWLAHPLPVRLVDPEWLPHPLPVRLVDPEWLAHPLPVCLVDPDLSMHPLPVPHPVYLVDPCQALRHRIHT